MTRFRYIDNVVFEFIDISDPARLSISEMVLHVSLLDGSNVPQFIRAHIITVFMGFAITYFAT